MKTDFNCIPCIINSYLRLAGTGIIPASRREEILRRLLEFLSRVDYEQSPPELGRTLHSMIRETTGDPDPYREVKEKYNRRMLDLYPEFVEAVRRSKDPFDSAMRHAIAGNAMDFASEEQLDVIETLNRIMDAELAVDDSGPLRRALEGASTLLYIGDNCGEIVLDRLFMEQINLPRMVFAVRSGPVINDATKEDAELTGMHKVAEIITTGDNAPGAVWASSSREFREHFRKADVVISKGQGNLEGLLDIPHDQIYFLLVVKCELIAQRVGSAKGEFIVKKGDTNP